MTIQEQIEVMKHFANGGEVEFETHKDNWVVDYNPTWNWTDFEYRIKQEPKKMVKLYKFAYLISDGHWAESAGFYKDKEGNALLGHEDTKAIRLDYTMIEVPL